MLKIALFFFLFLFSFSFSQKGNFSVKNYSLEEGLSHYKIQSVFKDKQGYLWIGTEDGLNKFNGDNFEIFKNNPLDTNTISSGNIFSITQDKNENIWVGIDGGGINIINPYTHSIKKIFSDENSPLKYTKHIYIDKENIAWISVWGGLIKYDIDKEEYKVFKKENKKNSICSSDIKKVVEDKDGMLWIATLEGLSSYDRETNQFTNYTRSAFR